ncbi:hypothetical protein ATCC90586_001405 [Pythium insidiosum]|nr:hypothetical protein ATCC90586_001405 [Pythium insidiosum]
MASRWYRLGAYCCRYAGRVALLSLLVSLLLCLGLLHMVVQTDPQKLWVPPTSAAAHEQQQFNELFGPFFRIEQLIFYTDKQAPRASPSQSLVSAWWRAADEQPSLEVCSPSEAAASDDLIDKKYLLRMAQVETAIREQTATVNGRNVSLEDFCYRPIAGKGCLVTSPFQYWLGNATLLEQDPDIKLTTACQTTEPTLKERSPCMDQNGIPVMRNVVFGGLSSDSCHENPDPCGESTPRATALMVTFLLHNNPENATYSAMVEAWEEQVFLRLAAAFQPADGMKLTYMAQRSVADSLEVQTQQNAFVVVVSYLVMFLYVSMSLGTFNDAVTSRYGLGFTGILIVLLALGAAMGVCSALLRMEVTMITLEVVPFLILAIGVDNMFILTNEFDRLLAGRGGLHSAGADQHDAVLEQVLGETMVNVGPSILVAAVSETLAFLVGALTRIPALESFCVVAALAVLADLGLQLTWFAAALALDARRVRARRYDLVPCLRQGVDLTRAGSKSAAPARASVIKAFVEKTYTPWLLRRPTKLVVLFASVLLVALSVAGAPHLPLGLEQELAVPTDFYLHEYFRVQTERGEAGPPAYLVLGDGIEYTKASTQQQVNALLDDLSSIRQYIQLPIFSWLHSFNQWRQMRYFLHEKIEDDDCDCPRQPLDPFAYELGNSSSETTTPDALFYPLVQNFTAIAIDSQCCQTFGLCGAQYAGDLVFRENATTGHVDGLRGARMRFQVHALSNQSMFINSDVYLHRITDKWAARLNASALFPYSLYFVFYEQYRYIQGVALQSVLLALLVVFVCVFLLMHRNVRLSVLVTLCVLSMTLSLLGVVFLWNQVTPLTTSINAVSVVNVLAAVGLGVEFCVHMAHQFDYSRRHRLGRTGDDHARHALATVGASILSGITLTKFCGIGVLAFAPSMLFRVYFFRMYLGIVLVGCFHGMVLLPVLLSLFGQPAVEANDFSTFLLSEERDDELLEDHEY